eukprot:TRINITY_DN2952_c0_g1_i1.p1 TRINITY_DN2952_c0_g1~~TRINITY_DN2952_c0_g1_i1.p1  ORF type:complete len:281 (+),score=60.57 TRINITY_DN2952_c0_g1_i1:27-845(+)
MAAVAGRLVQNSTVLGLENHALKAKCTPAGSSSLRMASRSSNLYGARLENFCSVKARSPASFGAVRAAAVDSSAAESTTNDESPSLGRFRLNNLGPQPGSRRKETRKGRGIAAGQGASCGFGMRGQKSRSGSGVRPGFEGGQMPLYRRLPKLKGIAGGMGAGLPKHVAVNLDDISAAGFSEGDEVTLERLVERRIVNPSGRERKLPLKVLGDGEIDVKLVIRAAKFSATAREKLEAAGCTLVELPGRKKFLPALAQKRAERAAEFFAKKQAA